MRGLMSPAFRLVPRFRHPASWLPGPARKPPSGWRGLAGNSPAIIRRKVLPLAILSFLIAWPYGADPVQRAQDLYDSGDFLAAARISGASETAEGYALAAGSLAAHAHFNASPADAGVLLEQALELAETAAEMESDNPDILVQFARVMGRYAQLIGPGRAANEGYGSRIKEVLDNAHGIDPGNPAIELLLATWHMEIVSQGGFLGALAFGASRKMALRQAASLDPESITVLYEYGRGVLELDRARYLADATRLLKVSLSLPARTEFDRKTQENARKLLERL